MKSPSHLLLITTSILIITQTANAQTVPVSNLQDLENAFNTVQPNGTILFNNKLNINAANVTISGTADNYNIDGNNGMIIGNKIVALIDMNSKTLVSLKNIEINNGKSSSTGGAISVGSITNGINNSAFRNNEADQQGGAVYVSGDFSGGISKNIHFDTNKSGSDGGGIFIGGNFSGGISGVGGDVHFDRNQAVGNGGGMYVGGNFNGNIYANYFANNTAGGNGGGLYVGDSFIGNLDSYSFFIRNTATGSGGGLYVQNDFNGILSGQPFEGNKALTGDGGGAFIGGSVTGDITGNFNSNEATAGNGGALHIGGDTQGSINGNFKNNKAGQDGGALNVAGSINKDVNAVFTDNTAERNGGAINVSQISGNMSSAKFTDNTATGNGGAVNVEGDITADVGGTYLNNFSLAGNGGAINVGGSVLKNVGGSYSKNSANINGGAIYITGTVVQDVVGKYENNNSVLGDGGAIYIGDSINENLNVTATGNVSSKSGGSIYVVNDINQNVLGTYTGNIAATGDGGAIYTGGSILGNISGLFVSNNSGASGGAISSQGNINTVSNTQFVSNTALNDGGAINATNITSINSVVFNNNSITGAASGKGGAIHLTGTMGDITTSLFNNNRAIDGSALYVDSFNGTISNTTFSGNNASNNGGAIYIAGTGDSDLTLSADTANSTIFSSNLANGLSNSIYATGSGNNRIAIAGTGLIAFYDPLKVEKTSGNFSVEMAGATSQLYWGGTNTFDVGTGTANLNFSQGDVQLAYDYTAQALNNSIMNVNIGSTGATTISMDMYSRDSNKAVFDYTNGNTSSTVNVDQGNTKFVAPRSLLPQVGRYLIIKDYTGSLLSDAQLTALIEQTQEYQAEFERDGNDLYIVMAFTPDTSHLTPNGKNSLPGTDDWLHNTPTGNKVSVDQGVFDKLKQNINTIPPEAAISMGLVGMNIHTEVAERALDKSWNHMCDNFITTKDGRKYCEQKEFSLWVEYLSLSQNTGAKKGYSGYHGDSNGIVIGGSINKENYNYGAYIGFMDSNTDFNYIKAKSDTQSTHMGLYGRYFTANGLRTTADFAYSIHRNTIKRNPAQIGFAKGKYDQNIYSLGLEVAYDVSYAKDTTVSPYFNVRNIWLRQNGYKEKGSTLGVAMEEYNESFLHTTLGVEGAKQFILEDSTSLTPRVNVGWRHNFGDKRLNGSAYFLDLPGTHYSVKSIKREREALILGVSAEIAKAINPASSWAVRAGYETEQRSNSSNNTIFINAIYNF